MSLILLFQTVFCTDEATFTQDGVFNTRDQHVCSHENPNAVTSSGSFRNYCLSEY